ncbi:1-deoxy-D-xylulose-5-phosphate reductoisomerase [Acidobacteria bacterium AH-259-G07]|nr:1-deoxy-D-xylulose-5-phosphate reductoisomerase [Acidobacteria bacterium AH-259-G07]
MKRLSILGSTGSIGKSALSLVDLYPDRFRLVALAARKNVELLYQQSLKYHPQLVALWDEAAAHHLRQRLPDAQVLSGVEGVIEAAIHPDADTVVAGITGAAGLIPTYRALLEEKDVALANKETLVMAGELIMPIVESKRVNLVPVDSEHCALHQCLRGVQKQEVHRLVLTASGGPFFAKSKRQLESVTVEEALNHPTWQMGPKITVDSATLMNKGLEVIEAHHLFGVRPNQISIVIHPQSTIHSMVEFIDGTVLAQMSITDMRSAILYALSYPHRWNSNLPRLDLLSLSVLEFHAPDTNKFPCIRLAYQSLENGRTYPAALNAANEVAVHHFLNRTLPFSSIPEVIEEVLNRHSPSPVKDVETVMEADRQARQIAQEAVKSLAAR